MTPNQILSYLPIETARLIIRMPTMADANPIQNAKDSNVTELKRWMSWSSDEGLSMQGTLNFLNSMDGNPRSIPLIAIEKATGDFVLSTGIDGDTDDFSVISTGYWINKKFEGKSYAFEAMSAIRDFVFETIQAQKLVISYYEGNVRSQNLVRRLGLGHACLTDEFHHSHYDGHPLRVVEAHLTCAEHMAGKPRMA